jgi:hypothetical protein
MIHVMFLIQLVYWDFNWNLVEKIHSLNFTILTLFCILNSTLKNSYLAIFACANNLNCFNLTTF